MFKDIKNIKFGKLTALNLIRKDNIIYWECICDCGQTLKVRGDSLRAGKTKSCGCLHREIVMRPNIKNSTHGMSTTPFYSIWKEMNNRCNNKNHVAYRNYGGRGIKCLWSKFEDFMDDMYDSYLKHINEYGKKQTSIDRIDNDGNYCKENCEWVTRRQQASNTRKIKGILCQILNGKVIKKYKTQAEAGRVTGIRQNYISRVVNGKRNHTGGYQWKIIPVESLTEIKRQVDKTLTNSPSKG